MMRIGQRLSGGGRATTKKLRRRGLGLLGGGIVVSVLLVAVFAPWIAPHDPVAQSLRLSLEPPRPGYWFGNDELGRDVFSRVVYGARISLVIGMASVLFGVVVGGTLGVLAGYFGGVVDSVIMRLMDVILSFPSLVLAVGIMVVLGTGVPNLILALGLRAMPVIARLTRNMTISLREAAFVEANRALGARSLRTMFLHIAPNILSTVIVVSTLRIGASILTATSLSFLGIGVPPSVPEWGAMISNGLSYVRVPAPHVVIFPSLAIVITVLGFNLIGDGVSNTKDY